MKIALVHDYLVQFGGAERVLEAFCELYPHAPIHTILYEKQSMHGLFDDRRIYTSFLQKFPFARSRHRAFPFLMPLAVEQFDFSRYDVVLSTSNSYAKGILTRPETLHVCYMHTPMRYAWDDCQKYTRDFSLPKPVKRIVPFAMNYIRLWDRISVNRVDSLIANSRFVARRIKKYYHKDATIIHPPIATERFSIQTSCNYYLMVGRLVAYKRFDLAIHAFNALKLPLKIIGQGPELERLKALAGPTITFLGRVDDEELAQYYSQCKAFVFPQEEDFGIVAIEALASGRPLVAYHGGDIPEHVTEGENGVFFYEQTPQSLVEAIRRCETLTFDSTAIRNYALSFDTDIFKQKIDQHVQYAYQEHMRWRSTNGHRTSYASCAVT